jgi:HAD superfamily hydrolase (TIGR01509 family)
MELHLQKTDIFMNLIDEGKIPLRPGVLRLVDEAIANNIRLAVCSTSNEKAVSNLVSTLMGEQRASKFQIFAGDMVKAKKPAPDVYLMAVDQMGLDKSRCVIIEDSHIGVGAAVAADIACLVTKSSYTANEDFTGAKLIVDELGADPRTGVTLATLNSLLDDGSSEPAANLDLGVGSGFAAATSTFPTGSRGIGVQMEGHIEKGGASWTGARFGDDTPQRLQRRGYSYTPSETYAASSPRGIGVRMEGHVERGGASWTGARFGEDEAKQLSGYKYTPSETYEASSSARGIGVRMEDHIEKGGASWTGARLGDGSPGKKGGAPTPSKWHE